MRGGGTEVLLIAGVEGLDQTRFDPLVCVRSERLGIVTDSGIPGPPDLCE